MHGLAALFGALMGFVAAVTPEIIQMLKERFLHQRQLEAKEQELNAAKQGYEYAIQTQADALTDKQAQIDELRHELEQSNADDNVQGHVVLQFLRSSVRPIVTYGFFVLFASVKIFALHHALVVDHTPVAQLLPVVWDEDTESLFAAVITFWFGSRSVNAIRQPKESCDEKHPNTLKGTCNVVSGG